MMLLAGCSNNSGSNSARPDPTVDFTAFVKAQVAATDALKKPVPVNPVDFSFNDNDNPQAYNDLLQ
ncbi:hypothetical protein FWJ25_08655 [Marinobacter salinexigens]|uniref:Uncharacterized protein n=2 Tax=Marinobacter salinexigens TaxID=2919747 RepID=A0A5B0VKM4_9GAMM|nr:hypothetical protein FWJ25_08655 [Marinobacter salinexigens]